MRTTHRVHFGPTPARFHSFRDFDNATHALAHLWAMANCRNPSRVWYWQGLDGWLHNDHMRGKPFPETLSTKITELIDEDNLATS